MAIRAAWKSFCGFSNYRNVNGQSWTHYPSSMTHDNLCYTVDMDVDHHIWRVWADKLHRWGMNHLAATFMDAAGPLILVGAQVIYLLQPLMAGLVPDQHLQALAQTLEDPEQARSFTECLREESGHWT